MAAAKPTRLLNGFSSRIAAEYTRGADVWSLFNPVVFPSAVNLGQGFMNWAPPDFVKNAAAEAITDRIDTHHYSHPKGRPRLRNAIADFYSPQFRKPASESDKATNGSTAKASVEEQQQDPSLPQLRPDLGLRLDPETDIQVTAGANGGIYSALLAFLEEDDEVILLEPFFDQYICESTFNGGVPRYVPLVPPTSGAGKVVTADEWTVDWDLLEKAMSSPKAKAIILNTPHNPIGKVFSLPELQRFAALAIKYDLLVIADEVYDCLTFDGKTHHRIAAIDGMWERTLTVGSAGKSFACTGWRIGWLIGAPHLIKPSLVVHTRVAFCTNSVASEGAAVGLEKAESENFFPTQVREYEARRKTLCDALDALGLPYTVPHGAYFIMVDARGIKVPEDYEFPEQVRDKPKDYRTCWFMAKTCDVVTIPASAFYSDQNSHIGENFIRFSFCKDGQLEEAAKRLEKLKPYLAKA